MLLNIVTAVITSVCDDGYHSDTAGGCVGNICAGGPLDPTDNANYITCDAANGCKVGDGCSRMRTGDKCEVGCQTGYTKSSGRSFVLTCSSSGTYSDMSNTICSPNRCSSPSLSIKYSDYRDCTVGKQTGDYCQPRCVNGYRTANQVSSFILSCDRGGIFRDRSGLYCQPDSCTAPTNPRGVDYSSCLSLHTDDTCLIRCLKGYQSLQPSISTSFIKLFCLGDLIPFNDDSTFKCVPNVCDSETPLNYNNQPQAIYLSTIKGMSSGNEITVSCKEGYHNTGTKLELICGNDGTFDDYSTSCDANTCSVISNSISVAWMNYADCLNKITGDQCTTTCKDGYSDPQKRTEKQLSLTCDSNGELHFEAMASQLPLVCEPTFCSGFPVLRRAFADYDSAKLHIKRTGDAVMITCLEGFVNSGEGFILKCGTEGQFEDTGTVCSPFTCQGFQTTNINGTSCEGTNSGELCTISCMPGYGNGQQQQTQLAASCTATGKLISNLNIISCQANQCEQPAIRKPFVDYSFLSNGHYQTGSVVQMNCIPGYTKTLQSNIIILQCNLDSSFTDSTECIPMTCGSQLPTNLQHVHGDQLIHTDAELQLSCSEGYEDTQGRQTFTAIAFCTDVGTVQLDESVLNYCSPSLCNGQSSSNTVKTSQCDGKRTGEICDISCNEGYSLQDVNSLTLECSDTGVAIVSSDLCVANACKYLPDNIVDHPQARYPSDRKMTGSSMTVTCTEGYFNNDPVFIVTCSDDGSFTDTSTSCVPHRCTKPTPPQLQTDYSALLSSNYVTGTSITFSCLSGHYNIGGPVVLNCNREGDFIDVKTNCVPVPDHKGCLEPFVPQRNANYSIFLTNRYFPKVTVTVPCDVGYSNVGDDITLECTDQGYFVDNITRCDPLTCDLSKAMGDNFAAYESSQLPEVVVTGMYSLITCKDGYSNTGTPILFNCNSDGSFIDDQTLCNPNSCLKSSTPLPHVNYSFLQDGYSTGTVVNVVCDRGYQNNGVPFKILCKDNGIFTDTSTNCEPNVCIMASDNSRNLLVNYTQLTGSHTGDAIALKCVDGYQFSIPVQNQIVICDEFGYFIDQSPSCLKASCSTSIFLNADPINISVGDTWDVKCQYGYHSAATNDKLMCVSNGIFNNSIRCLKSYCDTTSITNSVRVKVDVGEVINIQCQLGYHSSLVGVNSVTCLSNQKFSLDFSCVRSLCSTTAFSNTVESVTPVGGYWRVQCLEGYHNSPLAPEYLYCESDDNFNSSAECKKNTCSTKLFINTTDNIIDQDGVWKIECREGYHSNPRKPLYLQCDGHNTFNGSAECIKSYCSTSVIPNTISVHLDMKSTTTVQCLPGFHLESPSSDVMCIDHDTLNTTNIKCQRTACDTSFFNNTKPKLIPVGDTWAVECADGYQNTKQHQQIIRCEPDIVFNETDIVCEQISCSTTTITFAIKKSIPVGHVWNIECESSYTAISPVSLLCEESGLFNDSGKCLWAGCSTSQIEFAVQLDVEINNVWEVKCIDGYIPSGQQTIHCNGMNVFNETVGCRVRTCDTAGINNSIQTEINLNQTLNVSCEEGYHGSGEILYCNSTTFSFNPHSEVCLPNKCTTTETLPNGEHSTGDNVTIKCPVGYTDIESKTKLICNENGLINNNIVDYCIANVCSIKEATRTDRNYSSLSNLTTNQSISIRCNEGYSGEEASSTITCLNNGTVLDNSPICKPNHCVDIVSPGLFTNYSLLWEIYNKTNPLTTGTVIKVTCNIGTESNTSGSVLCDSNGLFDASEFGSCIPIKNNQSSPFYENPFILAGGSLGIIMLLVVVIIVICIFRKKRKRMELIKRLSEVEPSIVSEGSLVDNLNPMRPILLVEKETTQLTYSDTETDVHITPQPLRKSYRSERRTRRAVTLLPTQTTSRHHRPRRRAESVNSGKKSVTFNFDPPSPKNATDRDELQRAVAELMEVNTQTSKIHANVNRRL